MKDSSKLIAVTGFFVCSSIALWTVLLCTRTWFFKSWNLFFAGIVEIEASLTHLTLTGSAWVINNKLIKKYASAMMMDGATVQGTYQIGRFMNHLCAMSSAANHVAFHQECIGISRLFAGSIALLICVAISFIGGLLGVGMLARMEYSMRKKGRYKKRYATYAAMCTCAGAVAQVVGVACYWSFAGVLSGSWMTEIDFVNTSPYNGCYFSWYGGVFACLQLTTAAAMTIWNLTEKSLLSFERPEEEDDDEDFWEPFRRQQQGKKDRNREEDRGPHRQLAQNQGEPSLILPPRAPSAFVPPRMGR